MKKIFSLILMIILVLSFVACSKAKNENRESFVAKIEEIKDEYMIVKAYEDEEISKSSDLFQVSLDIENKEDIKKFNIGDDVIVYYDGKVAESYPAQINNVYEIKPVENQK